MKIVAGVWRHEAQTRQPARQSFVKQNLGGPAGGDGPLRHSFSEASVI